MRKEIMKKSRFAAICMMLLSVASLSAWAQNPAGVSYPIVDTGVTRFYSDTSEAGAIKPGQPFFGQDANYAHHPASYTKNSDGTISDHVTGLTWEADMGPKMTLEEALSKAKTSRLGGHSDWRVPGIKELYSLINFTGTVKGQKAGRQFIDTRFFKQPLGDSFKNEREIDAQTWSSTVYNGKTMGRDATIFGVNFVDGRIKGYPKYNPRTRRANTMYFRMVRGNPLYGQNNFIDNNDGTVSDLATGLMWQKSDSKKGLDWRSALHYSENLRLAHHDDWRLPSAKELQSIVDYTRSPQVTDSAAINPVFEISGITDPRGSRNYPYFWTATTHLDGPQPGKHAVYIAFGEALGMMRDTIMDVHGAGAQRSDPKSGNVTDYPQYFGPQGDLRLLYNYVRCVRSIR